MKIKILKSDVVYIDMDGVLVEKSESNFQSEKYNQGFFLDKIPIENAVESFQLLSSKCDVFILSTPVWGNQHCWTEKRVWVEKYLGDLAKKRLILTHNKALNLGKILIDDSTKHGVSEFKGIHIHFGTEKFPNWKSVLDYFEFE